MAKDSRFDISAWEGAAGPSSIAAAAAKKRKRNLLISEAPSPESSSRAIAASPHAEEDEEEEEDGVDANLAEEHSDGVQEDPVISRTVKPLTRAELEAYEAKEKRKGLIYISRIPRGMTPSKVRHLLSQFGDVSRLFLQDGSAGAQAKGSNQGPREKRKKHVSANYTEGWVEFEDKRVARGTAELLNAQPIGVAMGSCFGGGGGGAKKGGLGHSKRRWRDEVWTMRYLPGFKWNRLSEQLANERASHKSRLQAELSQSATEQRDYLKKVERARVQRSKLERLEARRASVSASASASTSDSLTGSAQDPDASGSKKRMQSERTHTFRQRRALSSDVRDKQAKMDLDLDSDSKRLIKRTKHTSLPDDALDRVLGQIF